MKPSRCGKVACPHCLQPLSWKRTRSLASCEKRPRSSRQRDEHQRMLLQELNHRVKNTLATVQSLARRTFKGDGSGRYERFEGRLLSLSMTHNLLTASEWQGAKLIDIVEAELAPYKGASSAGLDQHGRGTPSS